MTTTASPTARETVLDFHRAWTSGDIERATTRATTLLSQDVVCRAPGEDLVGREAYGAFLAGFSPNLTGVGKVSALAEDDRVALFYCPHTAVTSTAPAAEHFTVRDGLIVENVLVFDRLSYLPPEQPGTAPGGPAGQDGPRG